MNLPLPFPRWHPNIKWDIQRKEATLWPTRSHLISHQNEAFSSNLVIQGGASLKVNSDKSWTGITHKLKKHRLNGQGPRGTKPRECRRKRIGLSFIILPSGSDWWSQWKPIIVCVCVCVCMKADFPPTSCLYLYLKAIQSLPGLGVWLLVNFPLIILKSFKNYSNVRNWLWNSNECTSIPRLYFQQCWHKNGFDPFFSPIQNI